MEGKPLEIRARQEGQRHQTAVEGSGNEAQWQTTFAQKVKLKLWWQQ
jgi:hypothetical protein